MSRSHAPSALLALLLALGGCAPALEPGAAGERDASAGGGDSGAASTTETSGLFSHTIHEDGTVETVVDAVDETIWQYLDLDTRRSVDGPAQGWDLGFSRFRIRTNGGASGDGGVKVAALPGSDFDARERAPDEGFRSDQPDSEEDADSEPDNAFNAGEEDWYAYDVMTHTLSPRDVSYVIASTEARFYKLRIEGYYDDAGTPGLLRFRWAEIAAPAGDDDDDAGAPTTDAAPGSQ